MQAREFKLKSWQGVVFPVAARVVGENGVPYVKADISQITYNVYGPDGEQTAYGEGAFTVATSVFDTLQIDARWKEDAVGYNFAANIPGEAFPTPGVHRIEIIFGVMNGNQCPIIIIADILKVRAFS